MSILYLKIRYPWVAKMCNNAINLFLFLAVCDFRPRICQTMQFPAGELFLSKQQAEESLHAGEQNQQFNTIQTEYSQKQGLFFG